MTFKIDNFYFNNKKKNYQYIHSFFIILSILFQIFNKNDMIKRNTLKQRNQMTGSV